LLDGTLYGSSAKWGDRQNSQLGTIQNHFIKFQLVLFDVDQLAGISHHSD